MRVLIAEDDLTSRDILAALLEKNGYEVLTSENGKDALRIMQQPDAPHMVILDWLMPEIDGLEVCRSIRSIKTDIPPYIIMLTIKGNKDDVVAGLDTGADDYLSKPYDPGELRARVDVGSRIVRLEETLSGRLKELSESRELFRTFVENVFDTIYTLTRDGVFTYVSPNWSTLYGYNVDEIIGHSIKEFVHPDDIDGSFAFVKHVIDSGERHSGVEYRVRLKNGSWHWHTTNASVIPDSNGSLSIFLGVARDITGRKNNEDKIRSLLAEKELLLKEVHHRIKNNMNTIQGILSLQADTLKDHSAIAALEDAGSRLQSMMVLYDKLYQSESFSNISSRHYLPTLADEIIRNFPNSGSVKVENEIDDFVLEAKKLQPLGIIINELITNIMKYAFKGRGGGLIKISARIKDKMVTLSIQDNGNGMPESVNFENSGGFGLQLVSMLTDQIGGNIKIERGEGTRIILEFNQ